LRENLKDPERPIKVLDITCTKQQEKEIAINVVSKCIKLNRRIFLLKHKTFNNLKWNYQKDVMTFHHIN
jgi:hypothetical protein